jgi:hypothetical protein
MPMVNPYTICVISGFCGGVNEIGVLLGFYAASNGIFIPVCCNTEILQFAHTAYLYVYGFIHNVNVVQETYKGDSVDYRVEPEFLSVIYQGAGFRG